MIRDQGPINNVGFGVRQQDIPLSTEPTEGPDPQGGAIARKLHDDPVMRFFATSAVTMVGMHVGGKMLRKGGVRLGYKLENSTSKIAQEGIEKYKKVQAALDSYQGIKRNFVDDNPQQRLFIKDKDTKIIRAGTVVNEKPTDGFFIRLEEIRDARARSQEDPVAMWGMKDAIQQRLVAQARRLPYELPAAWAIQRGVTDPVFGTGESETEKVDWHNPVDVITDFVKQSTINIATMITPFEAGTAGGQQAWRKFMSYGDDAVFASQNNQNIRTASVGVRALLERMGHDASEVLQQGVRISGQTTGAFANAIQASKTENVGLVEHLHLKKKGMAAYNKQLDLQGLSSSEKGRKLLKFAFSENTAGGSIADQLPGPLKGMVTGVSTFGRTYRQMGEGYKHLDDLMSGSRAFSNFDNEEVRALQRVAGDSNPIADLAHKLANYSGGGNFKSGRFYQESISQEYHKQLIKRLQSEHGLSNEGAKTFADHFRVERPHRASKKVDISNRLRIGNNLVHELGDTNDFFDALHKRTSLFNQAGDAEVVARNITQAVKETDQLFGDARFMKSVDERLQKQWNHIEKQVVPRAGDALFRTGRLPYEDFTGQITDAQRSFLIRRSAEKMGMTVVDPASGTKVADHVLEANLRKFGLDPNNSARLKGFLVEHGAISKPWHRDNRNIFGLKPLTVGTAIDRGFFKTGTDADENISKLANNMRLRDPISSEIGDYTLGGVYQTGSGKVVDFSTLKRRALRFGDTVAANFQIPLIHIKPLEAVGWNVKRDARERSVLEIVPGLSNQAYLGDANRMDDDLYVWLKSRGSKGKVTKIGATKEGEITSQLLAGEYKLADPDANRIMGRNLRLGVGQTGTAPLRGDIEPKTKPGQMLDRFVGKGSSQKFKDFFNIDDHQPDSLKGVLSRFRNRQVDINNPQTFGRLLKDGSARTRKGTLAFAQDGTVTLDGKLHKTFAEVAEAFDNFNQTTRPYAWTPRVVRGMETDPKLKGLFGHTFRDLEPKTGLVGDSAGYVPISSLDSNSQVVNFARQLQKSLEEDAINLSPDSARALRAAQSSLIEKHLKNATDPSYWDRPVGQGARTATISTRIDELKNNLYRTLAIREELVNAGSFDQMLPRVMTKLDDLKVNGSITSTEFTEARTALLSMQIDYLNYQVFQGSRSSAGNRKAIIDQLRGSPESGELIGSYLTQHFETSPSSSRDYALSVIRRKFGSASDSYEGVEFNPFGYADSVFVPTFGTAYQRSGARAIGSVLGVNTWSNPEAFSGASVPVSHFFGRLNKPLQTLGMGLDMGRYAGPLDFYARGVIGQRALPLYAAGVGALTLDRTLGGMVNEKDDQGNRVYSPLVLGKAAEVGVHAQALGAGVVPGGMGYDEKLDQMKHGEVAVRQGRYWLLGNSPWAGGRIQYYRPSWYRRLQSGAQYTDETFGTPLERLAYGYDFSPLRPIDPYHYEKKTAEDRPYPVTGDYFTGPWGPLTPALNATVGRFLKPEKVMHQEALQRGLSSYAAIGESGMYDAQGLYGGSASGFGPGEGGAVPQIQAAVRGVAAGPTISSSRLAAESSLQASNQQLISAGGQSVNSAQVRTAQALGASNERLIQAAGQPGTVRPPIVPNERVVTRGGLENQASETGYRLQELFGIYGFAFGSTREFLGYGNQDMSLSNPVLQSSSYAFGSSRGFWDLNLGGLGDFPTPFEGNFANLEFSEVARRFVPKERTDMNYINPIENRMGKMYPWLPGPGSIDDFHHGDPYSQVVEGELRLPGTAYERLNNLHSDQYGRYGLIDQFKILGDVAPYSEQYREVNRMIDSHPEADDYRNVIETTRAQVQAKSKRYEFSPYKYKYSSADELDMSDLEFNVRQGFEKIQHAGTYFNTKFMPHNTAVEDWEQNHIYGSTFPSWSHPYRDFVEPLVQQNAQRNPLLAGLALGTVGSLFGVSRGAKAVGGTLGAALGFGASGYVQTKEAITGERHIPESRLKEMAVEEQTDILEFVKYRRLENQAKMLGDSAMASEFQRLSRNTMYGADLRTLNPTELAQAVPKRKREHFLEMLQAPEQERERILSTAPRLERRLYQAAWGYKVEERPDLVEYFQDHELPPEDSPIWQPNSSMSDIQIKVAQSLGLDLAQMGYYPQQISEANLINPTYPDHRKGSSEAEIRRFLSMNNIDADVVPIRTQGGNGSIRFNGGY